MRSQKPTHRRVEALRSLTAAPTLQLCKRPRGRAAVGGEKVLAANVPCSGHRPRPWASGPGGSGHVDTIVDPRADCSVLGNYPQTTRILKVKSLKVDHKVTVYFLCEDHQHTSVPCCPATAHTLRDCLSVSVSLSEPHRRPRVPPAAFLFAPRRPRLVR